jgi:hypothetical protein
LRFFGEVPVLTQSFFTTSSLVVSPPELTVLVKLEAACSAIDFGPTLLTCTFIERCGEDDDILGFDMPGLALV